MLNRQVIDLKNIGKKIADRLNEIDVTTEADLKQIGAVNAHKRIKKNYPDETLAICYYLYSFEGAITDTYWNEIPEVRKQVLKQLIGAGEKMIIDHIGLSVSDFEKSKEFYSKSLTPLGIELVIEIEGWAGFGKHGKPELWFGVDGNPQRPMHIAFSADSQEQVNQFYVAAISAGGEDNGKPGIREIYHPGYYGAFVIDPDGHNIEAVFHGK